MMAGRGRRCLSAAFFAAVLGLTVCRLPALADDLPLPRFESADCPFEIPSDGSVRYGRLVVPENRAEPGNGRTVSIAVLILKSRSGHPRPDPVLYLEGGPGGPSVSYYGDWLASPILEHRDLILFDQRGVGHSIPSLSCPEIRTSRFEALSPGKDPAEALSERLESARLCAARLRSDGVDLSAYNTAESARDLADLRRVLGIPRWNLYGISYGTRLALRLLREDPDGVRAVVLDSVVDPESDEYAAAPANASVAFNRFLAAVSADPAARVAFPDLESLLDKTVADLDRTPKTARIRLPGGGVGSVCVGGQDLLDALYGFLYDPDSIPYLPLFIRTVWQGDVAHLAMFAEEVLYDDLSDGLYYALQGHDEAPFSAAPEARPGLYDPLRFERDLALAFGSGRADDAANSPMSSDVPALVLAGGYDPVTPSEGSRKVAGWFSKGTFLYFPGLGHAVSMSSGLEEFVAAFLEDPSKPQSAEGLEKKGVRPFVTRLFMTASPYRLYVRVAYDRDVDVLFAILAFAGIFGAGTLSLFFTWKDRLRPGLSRWGFAARLSGGIGAFFDAAFMAALSLTVAFVNRSEPAMLFFGLPQQAALLPWAGRLGFWAGLPLVLGLFALFRDPGVHRGTRIFFAALSVSQVLFALVLANLGLI
jgi:pimeloyl-ACP methyl ester carboxylesterase